MVKRRTAFGVPHTAVTVSVLPPSVDATDSVGVAVTATGDVGVATVLFANTKPE